MTETIHRCEIEQTQVKLTNLNYSPEKAGEGLVPRVDLSLELAFVNSDGDTVYTFAEAHLKKFSVDIHHSAAAVVKCQLRVDPGEHLDELGDMRIAQKALFAFRGAFGEKEADEEGQGTLEL